MSDSLPGLAEDLEGLEDSARALLADATPMAKPVALIALSYAIAHLNEAAIILKNSTVPSAVECSENADCGEDEFCIDGLCVRDQG